MPQSGNSNQEGSWTSASGSLRGSWTCSLGCLEGIMDLLFGLSGTDPGPFLLVLFREHLLLAFVPLI